jgi:hypothetical protein
LLLIARQAAAQDLGENIRQAANVGPFLNQIQEFVGQQIKAARHQAPHFCRHMQNS